MRHWGRFHYEDLWGSINVTRGGVFSLYRPGHRGQRGVRKLVLRVNLLFDSEKRAITNVPGIPSAYP